MECLNRNNAAFNQNMNPQNLNQLRNRQSDDDDPQIDDDDINTNRGNKVGREPEREPSKEPGYLEEEKKNAEDPFAGHQYNLDESVMNDNDGQINQIMSQGHIQRPNFKTKFDKDL